MPALPQPVRQAQHPLPHRHWREDVIHQVRGSLGHSAAAATWTHRTTFTREGHQPVQPTPTALKAGESAGEPTAPQEAAKLLFDEPGQPLVVTKRFRLRAERLVMVAHDLIEHAVGGTARLIRRSGAGHPIPNGGRHADARTHETGWNSSLRAAPCGSKRVLAWASRAQSVHYRPELANWRGVFQGDDDLQPTAGRAQRMSDQLLSRLRLLNLKNRSRSPRPALPPSGLGIAYSALGIGH